MQIAIKRLQKEFYHILSINRAHLHPQSLSSVRSSSISTSDADSISDVMEDLRSIAECMISAGYAKECVSVYNSLRKSILDEAIYRLNLHKLSSTHTDWAVLELKIKSWLEAVTISVKTLFAGERILCDYVFGSSEATAESCFAHISRDAAISLFRFPELVARKQRKTKSPPEKMFRMLDMYSALYALCPDIESIFSFDSTSTIRAQVLTSLVRLSESVRTMFLEFESSIQEYSLRSATSNGGVHPLAIQTMNHLSLMADYSNVISDMMEDWPPPPDSFQDSSDSDDSQSQVLRARIDWVIFSLLCKLDGKAVSCYTYKDVSLCYLFLTNNLHHVIAAVRASNLQTVLGYEWLVKHEAKLKRFITNYEKVAWGQVFSCLPQNPKAAIPLVKAKVIFGNFNSTFEKTYRKHSSFVVADPKLRDEIKGSIERELVPVYRQFYDTQRTTLELVGSFRDMKEYVQFTPQDVANYVRNLFFEGATSGSTLLVHPHC